MSEIKSSSTPNQMNYSLLERMPIDILLNIFSYLSPEAVANTAATSNSLKIAAGDNAFWKKKLERHFPSFFSKVKIGPTTNWYAEFCTAYEKEYKNLPQNIRKLFSYVKEKDNSSLTPILRLTDLNKKDAHGLLLFEWIKKTDNQALLNHIYALAKSKFTTSVSGTDELSVTKTDGYGDTILHWAISCHQPADTIKSLISQGANIHYLSNGYNAIQLAAKNGQADVVESLITQFGAAINARDVAGATPIILAIEEGHEAVVNVLLNHNADLTLALHTSIPRHARYNVGAGDTPLHAAIKQGNINIIKALLAKGADIHTVADGRNALQLATEAGLAEIVELLITRYKADVNSRSNVTRATPIIFAIESGHKNVVDVLLNHNADLTLALHTSTSYHKKYNVEAGDTPLHVAIKQGNINIVKALLAKGADIDTVANDRNALQLAAEENQAEIVELLITQYSAVDSDTRAFTVAFSCRHTNVLDVFLKHDDHLRSVFLKLALKTGTSLGAASGFLLSVAFLPLPFFERSPLFGVLPVWTTITIAVTAIFISAAVGAGIGFLVYIRNTPPANRDDDTKNPPESLYTEHTALNPSADLNSSSVNTFNNSPVSQPEQNKAQWNESTSQLQDQNSDQQDKGLHT
jgi:ankyrin repeat protein